MYIPNPSNPPTEASANIPLPRRTQNLEFHPQITSPRLKTNKKRMHAGLAWLLRRD